MLPRHTNTLYSHYSIIDVRSRSIHADPFHVNYSRENFLILSHLAEFNFNNEAVLRCGESEPPTLLGILTWMRTLALNECDSSINITVNTESTSQENAPYTYSHYRGPDCIFCKSYYRERRTTFLECWGKLLPRGW